MIQAAVAEIEFRGISPVYPVCDVPAAMLSIASVWVLPLVGFG
jgi:hypothetical protein